MISSPHIIAATVQKYVIHQMVFRIISSHHHLVSIGQWFIVLASLGHDASLGFPP